MSCHAAVPENRSGVRTRCTSVGVSSYQACLPQTNQFFIINHACGANELYLKYAIHAFGGASDTSTYFDLPVANGRFDARIEEVHAEVPVLEDADLRAQNDKGRKGDKHGKWRSGGIRRQNTPWQGRKQR